MAVFPAINPIYSAGKQSNFERAKLALGDGYESSIVFGLNTIKPEWNLTWLVQQDEADQIEGFLQARSDAGEWFEWQPPDSVVTLRFRCDEWNVDLDNPMVYRISAVFRQVFELEFPTLNSVFAECSEEYLCEPDYGSLADFWMSRMTAPVPDLDPQTYSVDQISFHKILIDNIGNSYSIYVHRTPAYWFTQVTSSAYWYLVITKRDIDGNIIWSKRTSLSIACTNIRSAVIGDLGDGLGDGLIIIVDAAIGNMPAIPAFWINETWLVTFSLNGGFRKAYATNMPGATNIRFSDISNNLLFAAGDNGQVAAFMHVIKPKDGSFVTSYYIRQPGTIYASGDLPSDVQLIEMNSTRSLFFCNLGGNRIHVTRVNNGIPETTALFQSIPYTYSGSGATIAACKYENDTVLLFNYRYIYQYNIDGELIKIFNIPGGYIMNGADGIKLDKANDNIYINTGASIATIDYGLTTLKTMTYMTPQGNAYSGRNGTQQGGGNMMNLGGNRYVISMDTYAPYGQSASGGRGIFMIGGARLSKIGSTKTINVSGNSGTFTASIQGISINQAITEVALSYVSRYTVTDMLVWPLATSGTVTNKSITITDNTSDYVYNLFKTEFT